MLDVTHVRFAGKLAPLARIGPPEDNEDFPYVARLGLNDGDIPELVELAKRWMDTPHDAQMPATDAMWAPLHAWHALAELGAVIVIPTVLAMLDTLADSADQWGHEEFHAACSRIGARGMPVLRAHVLDESWGEYSRTTSVRDRTSRRYACRRRRRLPMRCGLRSISRKRIARGRCRRPRPSCCSHTMLLCVGRSIITVSMFGMSTPSLNMSTQKTISRSPRARDSSEAVRGAALPAYTAAHARPCTEK